MNSRNSSRQRYTSRDSFNDARRLFVVTLRTMSEGRDSIDVCRNSNVSLRSLERRRDGSNIRKFALSDRLSSCREKVAGYEATVSLLSDMHAEHGVDGKVEEKEHAIQAIQGAEPDLEQLKVILRNEFFGGEDDEETVEEKGTQDSGEFETFEQDLDVFEEKTQTNREILFEEADLVEKDSVEEQKKIQENLQRMMVKNSERLKNNVMLLQDALQKDAKMLDEVDDLEDESLSKIDRLNRRLEELSDSSWGGICFTIGLMCAVIVSFFATYVFMKIFPKPT